MPKAKAMTAPTDEQVAAGLSETIDAALARMKRAHDRKTGCHLTADMIQALGVTFLAQTWSEPILERQNP